MALIDLRLRVHRLQFRMRLDRLELVQDDDGGAGPMPHLETMPVIDDDDPADRLGFL